jgi:hypothetical protein
MDAFKITKTNLPFPFGDDMMPDQWYLLIGNLEYAYLGIEAGSKVLLSLSLKQVWDYLMLLLGLFYGGHL